MSIFLLAFGLNMLAASIAFAFGLTVDAIKGTDAGALTFFGSLLVLVSIVASVLVATY